MGTLEWTEGFRCNQLYTLVEFEVGRKTFDAFMKLAFLLEDLFDRRVELITPESLSPYISPHILNEIEYVNFKPSISATYPE